MAYDFTAASSQYLSTSNTATLEPPLTFAGWFNFPSIGVNQSIINVSSIIGFGTTNTYRLTLNLNNNLVANVIRTGSGVTGNQSAIFLGSYTPNIWTHACGVFESTSLRRVYQNAIEGFVNTNLVVPTNTTLLTIGANVNNIGPAAYPDGLLAEIGVWKAVLTSSEIASLAKGMTCDKIRPQNLIFYAPLIRNLQDVKGGLIITPNNGPVVAAHPRIYK